MNEIKILRLPHANDLQLPQYATDGSAGMDLCAAIENDLIVNPNETILVPTGFIIELPQGLEAQIRPRSGLAIKNSVSLMNAPGTIDSDYRGEIKVILTNFGKEKFVIHRGDRIAQMIIAKYERILWNESNELNETKRADGGFGHTGK
ncbi:MAG: dUTP diphosphatase [Bacteroidota bacterium]